jgi:hypothetical protein
VDAGVGVGDRRRGEDTCRGGNGNGNGKPINEDEVAP